MKDHLMTEAHLKVVCPYCSKDINEEVWESKHDDEIHYKQMSCDCGKNVWIRVDFHGSGHDSWDGTKKWVLDTVNDSPKRKNNVKTLENKIKLIATIEEKIKGTKK
jgi:phage FluMu protein Com